jgi:hypothetical protein
MVLGNVDRASLARNVAVTTGDGAIRRGLAFDDEQAALVC